MTISSSVFRFATVLLGACLLAPGVAMAAEARPNILVVMIDDMGYSDPGCFGGEVKTPNLDALAADGVRLRQFYNCARCCQTRASMLTGAYPHRVNMKEFGRTMDMTVPTVAENLRDSGYATAMVGKWHLSELPRTRNENRRILWMNHEIDLPIPFVEEGSYPTDRGFERFYGIVWGVVDHFDPFSLVEGKTPVAEVPDDFYFSDAITDRAVADLDEFAGGEKPFFLYVAYTAPHWPLHARPEDIAKYKNRYQAGWEALRKERFDRQQAIGLIEEETPRGAISGRGGDWDNLSEADREFEADKMAVHAAMVDRVDQGIGKIVEQLRKNGQLDNTVLVFLSDNGASPEIPQAAGYDRNGGTRDGRTALRDGALRKPENRDKLGTDESYTGIGASWASATNTPLRFWKAESYDGGCRTPVVIHWPTGLGDRDGAWVDTVGHVIDLAPTFYELAQAQPQSGTLQDGVSLAATFRGEEQSIDRTLYFDHGAGRGVRQGDWKASKRGQGDWELFNLAVDPGETNNLAREKPEVLEGLIAQWAEWIKTAEQKPASSLAHHTADAE
ncbi:arylsulfatase [Botrimarina mediterranea]|uniref:Arylsulfatase n=1 Tax=Botrimarina mediterranea TaxID=2528022 RepID=A0A518K843_9BACT|nr:arylsulfatase [Botrimarina mediterranea]QDV73966.1 Arylsulfatase [Botrimarina mediterranea]QDV78596.1 Arylsulfatase [Planctomycetes bacterium K2D]